MKTTRTGLFSFLGGRDTWTKGVVLVEGSRVINYALFPMTAFLEAFVRVAYSQWALLAVATHNYGEVDVVVDDGEEQDQLAA